MKKDSNIVIIGAGIFGIGAAIEFKNRGYSSVSIVDSFLTVGPNKLSSSYDISKIIRSDYGNDLDYVDLHTEALKKWREWNKNWGEELFHETGLLVASKEKLQEGSYVHESYVTLTKYGYPIERLNGTELRNKFPQWNTKNEIYKDNYFNPVAGWAESGRILGKRIEEAKTLGVKLLNDRMITLLSKKEGENLKIFGVKLASGKNLMADLVLVAAGAWTPILLPHLESFMLPVAQPVFHFQPTKLELLDKYRTPTFPVYVADIENTGFYGFPVHPLENCLKVGHHGRGYPMYLTQIDEESLEKKKRSVIQFEEIKFRKFLSECFPEIQDSKIISTRLCMYCDSFDGNFFIGRDPNHDGLAVASGGSGHGFKFAPVIGDIIVDSIEGKKTRYTQKFGWRESNIRKFDSARYTKIDNPLQKLKASL